MSVKENMLCSKSHEYVYEKDGEFYIGLTDYAIEQLGDIVFVELPEVGAEYAKGEIFGTVESVKAASEIYMPITGKVLEINEALIEKPELLNEQPFEDMWLIKTTGEFISVDKEDLLSYDAYIEEVK